MTAEQASNHYQMLKRIGDSKYSFIEFKSKITIAIHQMSSITEEEGDIILNKYVPLIEQDYNSVIEKLKSDFDKIKIS